MTTRIYLELRFPRGWKRMAGHYPSQLSAGTDAARIGRNWLGREGAPDQFRIMKVTEEIIETGEL